MGKSQRLVLNFAKIVQTINRDREMSQRKLLIGLPAALILGGGALAFGVVPGVRSWVDQTFPWLGIEGPKANSKTLNPSRMGGNSPDLASTSPGSREGSMSTEASMTSPPPPMPQSEVQRAQATVPVLPPSLPPKSTQPFENPLLNPPVSRFSQVPSFNALPVSGLPVPSSQANGFLMVDEAQVIFPKDITVAAQADGLITNMFVDAGSIVKGGQPMIEIDSRLVESEVEVSKQELKAAKLKASDESNLRFNEASFEVATNEVQISDELLSQNAEDNMANQRKRLELKKAGFSVDVAKIEKQRDLADVDVKNAKLQAANIQSQLRKIPAHWDGIVSEVVKEQFDWVRAGDPILRLTSLEKIRVKGNVKVADSPHLLWNSPARIKISIAEGIVETVEEGVVGFVSPRTAGFPNTYEIHVDLPNKLTSDGQFLFREGMQATIEIKPRTR